MSQLHRPLSMETSAALRSSAEGEVLDAAYSRSTPLPIPLITAAATVTTPLSASFSFASSSSSSSGSPPHDRNGTRKPKGNANYGTATGVAVGPAADKEQEGAIIVVQSRDTGGEFCEGVSESNSSLAWLRQLPICGEALASAAATAERCVPAGGHLSNIFNMASNTLGIGVVSMASGFNSTGIVLSAILMIVCGILVVFSFYLIGVTCERTSYRSWESACGGLLFRGADRFAACVMIFFQFGTMVGFVIAAHDLVGPFISSSDDGGMMQYVLTVVVWALVMLPLCLPRRVASLRYFSIIGVTLVIYFVFAVVAHSSMAGLPHLHDMRLFATGLDAVNGLTLFIFAFLSHGLCFRLFDEMQVPSARNIAIDNCGSVSLVTVLYFLVGFFGYAEFGLDMTGSIFKYYSVRSEPMMCVAYIGIMLKICVAYALSGQACRLPIYYLMQEDVDAASFALHTKITVPMCIGSLIVGLLIPDITIIFNLLGSICGGILAFLLPAFFVMYIGGWTLRRVGWVRLGLTYVNIVTGVVAIVFGTAVTIEGLMKE